MASTQSLEYLALSGSKRHSENSLVAGGWRKPDIDQAFESLKDLVVKVLEARGESARGANSGQI